MNVHDEHLENPEDLPSFVGQARLMSRLHCGDVCGDASVRLLARQLKEHFGLRRELFQKKTGLFYLRASGGMLWYPRFL